MTDGTLARHIAAISHDRLAVLSAMAKRVDSICLARAICWYPKA